MKINKPYSVLPSQTTDLEPGAGFYFSIEDDEGNVFIRGPFSTRYRMEEAIERLERDL